MTSLANRWDTIDAEDEFGWLTSPEYPPLLARCIIIVSRLPATVRRRLWKYSGTGNFYPCDILSICDRNKVTSAMLIDRIGFTVQNNLIHIPENMTSAVARQESAQDGKHEEVAFTEQLLISISLHWDT